MKDTSIPNFGSRIPEHQLLDYSMNAREIGRTLGVSAIRVRQICGSQNNPTNTFGSPLKIEGSRGNRWAKRNVYQYALEKGIDVEDMPPLLPHKDGTSRYTQIKELSTAYIFDPSNSFAIFKQEQEVKQVWIFVFEDSYLPRNSAPQRIFLVLPLYPTEFFGVHTALKACEQNASEIGFTADENSLVVAAPVISRQHRFPTIAGVYGNNLTDVYFNDYVNDFLECVGWTGMPVWYSGLSTAANLLTWQEGHTINLEVPIALANRWGLYSYALEQGLLGGELAASWKSMARSLYQGIKDEINNDGFQSKLLEPFYWAEKVTLPAPAYGSIETNHKDDFYNALLELISDDSSPRILAETALNYFGDVEYSRPQSALWSNLPTDWRKAILAETKKASTDFVHTVRARRLVQEFTKYFPTDSAHPIIYEIPQYGFYIAGTQGFTWISWLGYQRENPQSFQDALSNLWPENTLKVLMFMSSLDSSISVWAQTGSGKAVPFPMSTPNGLTPDMITLLILGVPIFEPGILVKLSGIAKVRSSLKAGQFTEYSANDFRSKFGTL